MLQPTPKKFSNEDWVREQNQDPDIGEFIQLLKGNRVEPKSLTDDANIMNRKRGRYILRNDCYTRSVFLIIGRQAIFNLCYLNCSGNRL